jgi:hypothetical protein
MLHKTNGPHVAAEDEYQKEIENHLDHESARKALELLKKEREDLREK